MQGGVGDGEALKTLSKEGKKASTVLYVADSYVDREHHVRVEPSRGGGRGTLTRGSESVDDACETKVKAPRSSRKVRWQ